jgi:Holliday junction DNA helicase RuvA
MIGYLKGKIFDKSENMATILVGGIGYEVFLPAFESPKLKLESEVSLYVYTHVREDILALYGFESKEEMALFKLLLSVSGIGPKVALSIIGSASIEKLKSSISRGDPALLSAVSGVGKKTAEKAVIELKGKLGATLNGSSIFSVDETDEVYAALTSLGFQKNEISAALTGLPDDIEGSEAKIKAILKAIGRSK